jgi:cellobiose phosphorylase
MVRKFRGATYNIEILNPENVSKGVKNVWVNGLKTNSNIVPILEKNIEHSIKVELGK